ncbi:MAG: RDD family protein [Acidobacteriota bacterium]
MSQAVVRQTQRSPAARTELVKDFHPETVKAPFALRCAAVLIDYIVVVTFPVLGFLLSRSMGFDGTKLLNSELNSAGWLIGLLLGISNTILLPMYSGQSIGKIVTGLRIVRNNGESVSPGLMAFRQVIGYLLIFASLGIGFFLSVFSRKGRALHDYLAGTVVIYADRRTRI